MSNLPPPVNKNQYQPHEFIKAMSTYKKGTATRAKMIEYILAKNLVPVKQSAVYAVLNKHANGETNSATKNV